MFIKFEVEDGEVRINSDQICAYAEPSEKSEYVSIMLKSGHEFLAKVDIVILDQALKITDLRNTD